MNPSSSSSSSSSSLRFANCTFAALLIATLAYFIFWGLGYTHHNMPIIFVLATLFGLFLAFNIGGNDVANSFGTSVGAGTLTVPQALLVAAVFEVSGAVIAGSEVTTTIREGIVNLSIIPIDPLHFIYVMMAAVLSAAFWLLFATYKGLPVSTTHSIVGGIMGSALCYGFFSEGESSLDMIQWGEIGKIALSWVISPVLGGLLSYIVFRKIKTHVLDYNDAVDKQIKALKQEKKQFKESYHIRFEQMSESEKIKVASAMARDAHVYADLDAEEEADLESEYYRTLRDIEKRRSVIDTYKSLHQWVPFISCIGGMMIAAMMLFKGLKNMNLGLSMVDRFFIMGMIGALIWMGTFIYAKTLKRKDLAKSTFLMFSWMQVFTAAGFAFSHGANDIANAIGPFAAIMDVIRMGAIKSANHIPSIVMITFGVALIVGLWFIGKEVIKTVGTNLAKMHPASGFTAELSAATVVMVATILGLPVSSTHILVGAVLGIGMVNRNTNWRLMKPIGLAWVITLPSSAILSALFFLGLQHFF